MVKFRVLERPARFTAVVVAEVELMGLGVGCTEDLRYGPFTRTYVYVVMTSRICHVVWRGMMHHNVISSNENPENYLFAKTGKNREK